MAYRVELSRRAERDIEAIFEYIAADAPMNAARWRRRLEEKIDSLEQLAGVFGRAPEDQEARTDVRQMIFGRCRILHHP